MLLSRHCEQILFAWQSFAMTSNHEIASSPSSSQRRKPLVLKSWTEKIILYKTTINNIIYELKASIIRGF